MSRRLRRSFAALAIATLLAAPGTVLAESVAHKVDAPPTPAMMDVAVMRPLGLAMLGVSAALWVPMAGITAVTRPSELGMVTEAMIHRPVRFVFADPIGSH